MRQVERDSGEWHKVWGALAATLKGGALPAEGCGQVQCGIDDFMLMGMDDNGTAHFKNVATRSYLLIGADGAPAVPAGAFFACKAEAANYRVEHHGNCILVFGAVPLSKFGALTKLVPKDSIMDPHLARIAGASFAMGPREETGALVALMSGAAIERARAMYAGTELGEDAVKWIAVGERGSSSEAVFLKLAGIRSHGMSGDTTAHPHDIDDLRRCRLLLEQVPELAVRIGNMSGVSREWTALISKWDEICRTMDEEAPGWRDGKGSSPNTNALIRECLFVGVEGASQNG